MPLLANSREQIASVIDNAERARLGLTHAQWKALKAERKAAENAVAWEAYRAEKLAEATRPAENAGDADEIDFLAMLAEIG